MEPLPSLLFFSWGGGLGHVSRCAVIGRAAKARGWRVIIAVRNVPAEIALVRAANCEPVVYPADLIPQELWQCWRDYDHVRDAVEADGALIARVGADVVVHDNRPSAVVAANAASVPAVSICQQVHLAGFAYDGASRTWSLAVGPFNRVLSSHDLPEIGADLRELYARGLIIVPSIPEFDPVPDLQPVENLKHVGPLTMMNDGGAPVGDRDIERSGIFFYRTVFDAGRAAEFMDAFGDLGSKIMIATGDDDAARRLRESSQFGEASIRVMFDMSVVARTAKCAVTIGGHGSCLSCIQASLPSVIALNPSPERELNAEWMERMGLGRVLRPQTTQVPAIPWAEVRSVAERLASDSQIRSNVAHWHARLQGNGAAVAVDHIAEFANL